MKIYSHIANASNRSSYIVDFTILALCLTGIFASFQFREFIFFRDYSIIFEGSYRLFLGQIPYLHFGTPVGPVSFVLPAIFFKIFSPNWTVFILSQQCLNACFLFLMYALLNKIDTSPAIKRISLISFSLFYLILLTHPWYNITGTFFMLASTLFALEAGYISVLLSGLLAGLAMLSKQDFGIFTIIIACLLIIVVNIRSVQTKILPSRKTLLNKNLQKLIAIKIILFALSVALVIAAFISATNFEQFIYWFNFGQKPHEARSIPMKALILGILGWIGLAMAIIYNNFRLFVASIFIIVATITRHTSGLNFSHYYYVGFLPVIVYECLRINTRFKKLLATLVIIISLLMMANPIRDFYRVFESSIRNQPEHFFFNYRKISRPVSPFPHQLQAFSPQTMAPQQTIDAILDLKYIAKLNQKTTSNEPLKVLNISELTPIYAELGSLPPLNLPLWFHSKVSLFPKQIQEVNKLLAMQEFDIILLQGTHEGLTEPYLNFLLILNANRAYILKDIIQDSPANAADDCKNKCKGEIFIYTKI